ncbi:hypothetical protein BU15DRAFT_67709 [Melanogaster broomeanus]|nr:hypothetical protein BU15DRAFT_67709 [Melanogaster broomeanus]
MSSTSTNLHTEFEAFAEKAGQDIKAVHFEHPRQISRRRMEEGSHCCQWYIGPSSGKPGPDISSHHWSQSPKPILKGKGVDPLERGGRVEAGRIEEAEQEQEEGRKDGKHGDQDVGKGKEKAKERLGKGSDGGRGRVEDVEETRGRSLERKPKKLSKGRSSSRAFKSREFIDTDEDDEPQSALQFEQDCLQLLQTGKACTRRIQASNPTPKQPTSQVPSRAQSKAPSRAQSRAPSRAPSHRALQAKSVAATSTHRSPCLEPAPSPAKKAKTSLSKSTTKSLAPEASPTTRGSGSKEKLKLVFDGVVIPRRKPSGAPIPARSIARVIQLNKTEVPTTTITDTLPNPSSDPKDAVITALEGRISSLEMEVAKIPELQQQVVSLFRVVEALRQQVQDQPSATSPPGSSTSALPTGISVSHEMQRLNLESVGSQSCLLIELDSEPQAQSHLGIQLAGPPPSGASVPSPLQLLDADNNEEVNTLSSPSLPVPPILAHFISQDESGGNAVDEDALYYKDPRLDGHGSPDDEMPLGHLGNGMGKPAGNPHGLWVQLRQSCVSGSQTLSEAMERVKPRVSVHTRSDGYGLDYGQTIPVPAIYPYPAVTGMGWTMALFNCSPCMRDEASGVIGYSGGVHAPVSCTSNPYPSLLGMDGRPRLYLFHCLRECLRA